MANSKVEDFREWIKSAKVGKVFIYHTGHLAVDRGVIVDNGTDMPLFIPNGDIHELGKLAIRAFEQGVVYLFQRKLHDNVWEYIAMKKSRYGRQW